MDADSSYGGSDTAQDSTSGQDTNSSIETTQEDVAVHQQTKGTFYHKNEVTLPVNYDEPDHQRPNKSPPLPHYMSTANLNINETLENHTNLEELNKKYNSTSYLNATPRSTRKSGVDNPAFVKDEKTMSNSELNNSFKSPSKNDNQMAEAVNLELINLKPNGKDVTGPYENGLDNIPVKKEMEVEIGNPYDEYFVPVNEHRKYMRGEKLYITMDKRNRSRRNKCLCWGLCVILIAALVVVGVLIATGTIGMEAQPAEEVSSRQFGKTTHNHNIDSASVLFGPKDREKPPFTPQPSTTTLPSLIPTDTSLIQVPRALESQFTINNLQFQPELGFTNSSEFREMALILEEEVRTALFQNRDINIKVIEYLPGSVIVRYRISWGESESVDEHNLKEKFSQFLSSNSGYMNQYRISSDSIAVDKIIDQCKIENNGCEYTCLYDYELMDFQCKCPEHMQLMSDNKRCLHVNEHHVHMHELEITEEPLSEPEIISEENYRGEMNLQAATVDEPEPIAESEPEPEPTQTEPAVEPEPNAEPEPSAEHEFEQTSEQKVYKEPPPEPTSEPEPSAENKYESSYASELTEEPAPEPNAEPEPTPKPHSFEVLSETYNESKIEPETTAEPNSQAEPEPTVKPEPNVEHESSARLKEEAISESNAEPEPTTQPKPNIGHELGDTLIEEVITEPNAEPEPTVKPDPNIDHELSDKLIEEATSEPDAEPEPTAKIEPDLFRDRKPETNIESESTHESNSSGLAPELNQVLTTEYETTTEPRPREELTVKPAPILNPEIETGSETTVEPKTEHQSEMEIELVQAEKPDHELGTELQFTSNAELNINDESTETANILESKSNTEVESINEPTTQHYMETNTEPESKIIANIEDEEEKHKLVVEPSPSVENESHTESEPKIESDSQSENNVEVTTERTAKSEGTTLEPEAISYNIQHTISNTEHVHITTTNEEQETSTKVDDLKMDQNDEVTTINTEASLQLQIVTNSSKDHDKSKSQTDPAINTTEHNTVQPITEIPTEYVHHHTSEQAVDETTLNLDPEITFTTEVSTISYSTTQRSDITNISETTLNPELKLANSEKGSAVDVTMLEYMPFSVEEKTELPQSDSSQTSSTTLTNSAIESDNGTVNIYERNEENVTTEDMFTHHIPVSINSAISEIETENYNEIVHTTSDLENTTKPINVEYSTIYLAINEQTTQPNTLVDAMENVNEPSNLSETHENLLISEPTEHSNNLDSMSPFLPEIENDTLVHILHAGGEILEHIKEENHDNEAIGSLHDDQMNLTNPLEISDGTHVIENVTLRTVIANASNTEKAEIITLTPDIINNVHSNSFFEKLDSVQKVEDLKSTTETSDSLVNFKEITSSTEDLVAMETTTYALKSHDDSKTEVEPPSTIFADIIETITEVVNFTQPESRIQTHQYEVSEPDSEPTTQQTPLLLKLNSSEVVHQLSDITDSIDVLPTIATVDEHTANDHSNDIGNIGQNDGYEDSAKTTHSLQNDQIFLDESTPKITYDKANKKLLLQQEKKKIKSSKEFESSKPVTEGFTITGFSRCAAGQFQCLNGTSLKNGQYCIPRSDRCDSVDDCSDGSDEFGCVEERCPDNFQCSSGQCLKRILVCDGILDCDDGTDEINCESWTCRFDEFSCGEGQKCVPLSWKCDGREHCPKGNDEDNCYQQECSNDEFHCTAQNKCIPASWRCDRHDDCANAEDEKICECATDQFKCSMGGGCIPLDQRCDGLVQCPDKSDEWNCFNIDNSLGQVQVLSSNSSWLPICDRNWNLSYSDVVCESLGYHKALSLDGLVTDISNGTFFTLNLKTTFDKPILGQLQKTDGDCNKTVGLSCEKFGCGIYNSIDEIEVNKASISQWPSVALLFNTKRNVKCTATLIAPQWALTSYSCVSDIGTQSSSISLTNWKLIAGTVTYLGSDDNATTQSRNVLEIISHPRAKYVQFEYINDVALIKLEKPLNFGENVSAICLPTSGQQKNLCFTAGYSGNRPGEKLDQYQTYIPVPTTSKLECNSTEHFNGHLSKDKICTSIRDSDETLCINDEGTPLMCRSNTTNRWELHGILSHRGNCGKGRRHPTIFTSIGEDVKKWIFNSLGSNITTKSSTV